MMLVTTAFVPPTPPRRAVLVGLGRGPQVSLFCAALACRFRFAKTAALLALHGVRGNKDSLPASLASLVLIPRSP